ncbi:MAG: hypothetical protein O8C66_15040 [Candidatus Methanoperedens sp.]|nr:hypothetical protein [Candidatus Methanoperedens sp.]MCZ7371818.1 hypothetical protein [Candidatus Methanoperedens sp.]
MKKIIMLGIAVMAIFSAIAVYAQISSSSALNTDADVQGYVGTLCFQPQGFGDIYVLNFDKVGNAYQVTGGDAAVGSAVNGGGMQYGTEIFLTMDEAYPPYQIFGEHAINISLKTLNATDSVRFSDINDTVYLTYSYYPFIRVACSPAGAPLEKGKSFAGR